MLLFGELASTHLRLIAFREKEKPVGSKGIKYDRRHTQKEKKTRTRCHVDVQEKHTMRHRRVVISHGAMYKIIRLIIWTWT